MWDSILVFLDEWSNELGAAAVLAAAGGWLISHFRKKAKTHLSDETIEKIAPHKAKDGPALTIPEYIRIRRELKADLEQELVKADDAEKDQLRARISELESQITDPEPALKIANDRIADLETRLTREANHLGADKLTTARAALESGDYAAADALFTEIEARANPEVQSAARAAFARGEIAEAEVRWPDAAKHYGRAAGLEPSLAALRKAADYAERAGDYPTALAFGEQAVKLAREGDDQIELASVLDNHAITLKATGRYDAAEPLYHEAIKIGEATLGTGHPDYATSLNNLAELLETTGRTDEAEPLYREAIKIGEATLGTGHPNYASSLNNLAKLFSQTERVGKALPLVEQALEIYEAALGNEHPDTRNAREGVAMMRVAAGKC